MFVFVRIVIWRQFIRALTHVCSGQKNPPNICEEKILGFCMCHFNNNYLCTYAMIYTASCVMLLMRAASITWASGMGLGPVNRVFCETAPSLEAIAIWGTKNSGPTPSSGPRNEYCLHQNHYVPRHINSRYIKIVNSALSWCFHSWILDMLQRHLFACTAG